MQEKDFNLLEKSWIKVITPSLEQKEVSLLDVILCAHEYTSLSGETPTQDVAVLRVLLALVETIFYRYDAEGEKDELLKDDDPEMVLERWKNYWALGKFPEQAVRDYLKTWEERFWLFHPETPFWQVSNLKYGTDYNLDCLFGNIKESKHETTKHHFSMVDGEELTRMCYEEAARWLIHLNAYAVNIQPDKTEGVPGTTLPVKVGRLGQLGVVMINGNHLFETLMLNLCPLKEGKEPWGSPKPTWEKEVCILQSNQIAPPDNLPELYTMQSRRIMLKREDGYVIGFKAMRGDFYPVEDDFNEPMTLWSKRKDKNLDKEIYVPRLHDPAVHSWREFPALFEGDEEDHSPGVVQWMQMLCNKKIIAPRNLITFRMVGMVYGNKNFIYGDCVDDTIEMSAGILEELGKDWVGWITDEVEKCQSVAEALKRLAAKLNKLFYGTGSVKSNIKDLLVSRYYVSIDHAFRQWLVGIDPTQGSSEEKLVEWERKSSYYARKVVEDYIATLGMDIFIFKEGDKGLLTVPSIQNEYHRDLRKIYKL